MHSRKEIADLLGVDGRTVTKLIETGQLRAIKVAGQYRIKKEWLDAYIQAAELEIAGQTPRSRERHRASA